MTLTQLLRRNLLFHWRGNLAVCLGVAVGCAVLTGALLVGDSLRGSLRELTEQRLGWVDLAMVTPRFFRSPDKLDGATNLAPTILLQGSATASKGDSGTDHRAGRVTILGVDRRFWVPSIPVDEEFWGSSKPGVALSKALADELQVKQGDTVTLHLQQTSAIPREALFGRRDGGDVLAQLQVPVRAILGADHFGSRFSLSPNAAIPRNAYVPVQLLQTEMKQQGRVNALLARGQVSVIAESWRQYLTLDDWGLVLWDPESRTQALFDKLDRNHDGILTRPEWRDRVPHSLAELADKDKGVLSRADVLAYYQRRGYLSLESRQLLLEPAVEKAALEAARALKLRTAPTLVYLANSITEQGKTIPYSIVAALDPSLKPPLGPFLPPGVDKLKNDEIILADWDKSPLPAHVGDTVSLTFFEPVDQGRIPEKSVAFKLRGVIPMQGVADDADLTPEFPGITDKLTLRDWNPPFPYDGKRVQKADEDYWNVYRTTPKAYITLEKGQQLWSTRFGRLTSIRLAPADGKAGDLTAAAVEFRKNLLEELRPGQGGFVFDNVRERGLAASAGGVDFSVLFLCFSFFLIAAALLLVGLLVRLNLDRRAAEIGLLLATGYPARTVRRLLLAEGALLAALGGVIGCVGAVAYAHGLLDFLNSHWPGDLDRSFLRVHTSATSFLIGYGASLVVSLLTIAWAVRVLRQASPVALLAGQTIAGEAAAVGAQPRWSRRLAIGGSILGLILIVAGSFVSDPESQAGSFFSGGALLLTAGLAGIWYYLRRGEGAAFHLQASPHLRIVSLGMRNAARNPTRSLLTAGLLASSAFLIVAVESFRRQPGQDFLDKNSGSGGFALLAESDVPIYQDLNQGPGRQEIVDTLDRRFRQQPAGNGPGPEEKLKQAQAILEHVHIEPLRRRAGDDASCLNLYQPNRPRLLGVPRSLIERGGFQFAATMAKSDEDRANPWRLLERREEDGTVPVFGEANSLQWMLHKGLGDIIELPGERGDRGEPIRLRVAGILQDSIFQGELLMSEANFLQLFPAQQGYNFFLIETPPSQQSEVDSLLETALADRGFDVTPSAQRLASYLAVENTYLSTFQALGGLGLLLGSLGLAVVLMRSVWERRGELALLRALGFRRQVLGWLVLAENAALLGLGLAVGMVTAFVSVAPHLLSGQGHVSWSGLLGVLGLVLVVGLAAGSLAMRATLSAPLVPALRRE